MRLIVYIQRVTWDGTTRPQSIVNTVQHQIFKGQNFRELAFCKFSDSLAMPTICAHSCNKPCSIPDQSAFAQGRTLSRAFLVLLVGAHQLHISIWRRLPIDECNDVEGTYDDGPQESERVHFETTIESYVACDVHTISGIAIVFQTIPRTPT